MENSNQGKYSNPVTATLKGITDLFKKKIPDVEIPEESNVIGKKVMITGASSGLGLSIAKRLAKQGANIIMACRSGIPEKGEEVKSISGNENVEMKHVDLSDRDSIKSLIKELKNEDQKIDILILNAAIVPSRSRKTKDGLEEMFMVNYLAKYYLVNGLIEASVLGKENSRVIFVSSESHRNPSQFEWDKFAVYEEYTMGKVVERYGYFKLFLTTLGQEYARRFPGIEVYTLCPGPVNSNIAREAPKIFQPLLKLTFSIFFASPEKASDPVIYFSNAKKGDNKSGDYLFLMNRKPVDELAADNENGKILWEKTEKLVSTLEA